MKQKIENSDAFGLLQVILFANKNRKKILLISLIASSLCFFVLLTLENQYTSSSVLKLRNQETAPSVSNSPFGDLSAIARGESFSITDSKQQIGLILGLINSKSFYVEKILADSSVLPIILGFKSYESDNQMNIFDSEIYDPLEEKWFGEYAVLNDIGSTHAYGINSFNKFLDYVEYSFDKESSLLTISVTHPSPLFAKKLLDSIINAINLHMQKNQILDANKSLNFLYKELENNPPEQVQVGISSLIYKNLNKKMLASIENESYYFEIIDKSYLPSVKSAPNRGIITALFFMFATLFQLVSFAIYSAFKEDYANFSDK